MSNFKEIVEYVAAAITDHPEDVEVVEEEDDGRVFLVLRVNSEDKGKVIGRQGRVVQSIRSLLRVAAVKEGVQVNLEIE
tara:strand:+ start:19 stop:255 length:237 start_codon:yes stop_codon:yes gene_type:complete